SMNVGNTVTGVVTGKPVSLGGSLGRAEATGRGVFVMASEAMRRIGLDMVGTRVSIQGFGNVGGTAARLFHQAEASVVAVQDHTGTVYNPAGLNVFELTQYAEEHGGVAGFVGGESLPADDFWRVDTDIL